MPVILIIISMPLAFAAMHFAYTPSLVKEREAAVEKFCAAVHDNEQNQRIAMGQKKFEPMTTEELRSCKFRWLVKYGN